MLRSISGRLRKALRDAAYALGAAASPGLPPLDAREAQYLATLKAEIAALPEPRHEAEAADSEWTDNLIALRCHILNDDARAFLHWPVVLKSMFVNFSGYIVRELAYLRAHDWPRWKAVLKESRVGRPFRFPAYPASSGNLIHHAYHLARFEAATDKPVPSLRCVVEFGGGYGSLCRAVRKLGFAGPYIIFDLPYFSALQRYYLRTSGFPVANSLAEAGPNDIICLSDFDELEAAIARFAAPGGALQIGTWSLSETPLAIRDRALAQAERFDFFLIGYQGAFGGVDNEGYFARLSQRLPLLAWQTEAIPHIPGSSYLFGARKSL